MSKLNKDDINYLLSPKAIRNSTGKLYEHTLSGKGAFLIHEEKLEACADYVLDVIYDNYPNLEIPFHSRWGHFQVGGVDRMQLLEEKINEFDPLEKARVKIDLVITSVLLDAGAGPRWKYIEEGKTYNRSEGLAVASFHMFLTGAFSQNDTLKADSQGLVALTQSDLEQAFQVSDDNPLVGVEGRLQLLKKLGECVENNSYFPGQRPGGMLDYLIENKGKSFEVGDILDVVLKGMGSIWPGRIDIEGTNLGDVWHYPPFGEDKERSTLICFHKLSQWLTYSLVAPMEAAGCTITGAHKLTGLAEYRNGGLFVDFGVLELKDKSLLNQGHKPGSEIIIEWRALTLQLLDKIGAIVQKKLNKSAEEFPLAKVLEGGTWWAGRKLAAKNREDSSPPLTLDSDGTVF